MANYSTDAYIGGVLNGMLVEMEKHLQADIFSYLGPIQPGADNSFRGAVERRDKRRRALAIILETEGGSIDVVRRMVDVTRRKYEHVSFIIPNYAYSAGTVLALSGNEIYMDDYAVLGPIDPQIPDKEGRGWMPGLGYLIRYEKLLKKAKSGSISQAELNILVHSFDQGLLYFVEQGRDHATEMICEWLPKYKWAGWDKTDTRGNSVTPVMKNRRAKKIASQLNNPDLWHSHARGIPADVLRNELELKIEDLNSHTKLYPVVRQYYELLVDYMTKLGIRGALHAPGTFEGIY